MTWWLRRWFRRRRRPVPMPSPDVAATVDRIERDLHNLSSQFRTHALEVDAKLELYGVVIPKVLMDVTAAMNQQAAATRRLADILESWQPGALTKQRSA